jgi:DNA topoisomerase-3
VYSLPSGGNVRQFSGRLCDRVGCNFELCLYVVGNPPRCYPLCPNCYNHPDWSHTSTSSSSALQPDKGGQGNTNTKKELEQEEEQEEEEEEEKHIGNYKKKEPSLSSLQHKCHECPLADHHPTVQSMKVCDDPESGGCFILDPSGGPKWRLVSTRSSFSVHFPKKRIKNIQILDKVQHGCHWIKLYFHDGASPCKDKSTTYSGCLLTDTFLHQFLYGQDGSDRMKSSGRGGRRGGRGGRGGRRGGKGGGRRRERGDRDDRGGGRRRRGDRGGDGGDGGEDGPTTSVHVTLTGNSLHLQ